MFTSTLLAPEVGSNVLDDRDLSGLLPFLLGLEFPRRPPPCGEAGGGGPDAWGAREETRSGLALRRDPVSDEVGGLISLAGALRALRECDLDRVLGSGRGDRCRCLGDLLRWRVRSSASGRGGRPSRGERDLCRRGGLGDLERPGRLLGLARRSRAAGERGRCGRGDSPR